MGKRRAWARCARSSSLASSAVWLAIGWACALATGACAPPPAPEPATETSASALGSASHRKPPPRRDAGGARPDAAGAGDAVSPTDAARDASASVDQDDGVLRATGLTIDTGGYWGDICIGSFGCYLGGVKAQPFDLPPGTHTIASNYSISVHPGWGGAMGTITVDGSGRAMLDSPHFDRVNATTIRAKTVPIKIDPRGSTARVGFDGAGAVGTLTPRLLVGRRYPFADYESFALTADTYRTADDFVVDFDGVVSFGPSVAEMFTWDGVTLAARTFSLTIDQRGYKGVFALGSAWKQGPVIEFGVLPNRRYALSDYRSLDGVRGTYTFAVRWDVHVDRDGVLHVGPETSAFVNVRPAARRIEPKLGTIQATPKGACRKVCLNFQPLVCARNGQRMTTPMILGRDFRIDLTDQWIKFDRSGACTPDKVHVFDGKLTFKCRRGHDDDDCRHHHGHDDDHRGCHCRDHDDRDDHDDD